MVIFFILGIFSNTEINLLITNNETTRVQLTWFLVIIFHKSFANILKLLKLKHSNVAKGYEKKAESKTVQ